MDRIKKTKELLSRGVTEIIGEKELVEKLKEDTVLRIKLGIDPTSPNIHLGRSIPLLKLKDFQDLGHQIVFLIGNFTAQIGDTSDKESERPMLTEEDVQKNLETYLNQASKIIDLEKAEVVYNKEWLEKLNYQEIGRQADAFSLNEFISRENIKKRLDEGKRVSLRELLYPLMQGFDSVKVEADVELGGTDQKFNLLAGRDLQRLYGQEPQSIILGPIVEGLDGRKMSSSYGNTINLFDDPNDMFGKIMSLNDDFIITYFKYLTRIEESEIKKFEEALATGVNPKDIKATLGKTIVTMYHDEAAAKSAQENWESTFSQNKFPEDAESFRMATGTKLIDILVEANLVSSKTEARRFIENNAVKQFINNDFEPITEETELMGEVKLKVGKKKFATIEFTD